MHPLLIPRYKVIADYPGSRQQVGEIYTQCPNGFWRSSIDDSISSISDVMHMDQYPNIFQKLEWWEDLTVEQMPEYVKWNNINEPDYTLVMKPDYCPQAPYLWEGKLGDIKDYQFHAYDFLPATEEEYKAYLENQLNKKE